MPTVLIVDDNPADRVLVQEAFAEAAVGGGQVDAVESVEAALAVLARAKAAGGVPRLLLCDYRLAGTPSQELLAAVTHDPALAAMAVATLSGDDRRPASVAGEWYQKPGSWDACIALARLLGARFLAPTASVLSLRDDERSAPAATCSA